MRIQFTNFPEENDTDLETDRLLGQQRTEDQSFYEEKVSCHSLTIYVNFVDM